MHTANLRNLPSVDRLVAQFEQEDGAGRYPHRLLVDCARAVVDQARSRLLQAESVDITLHTLLADLRTLVQTRAALTLTRAVNATGIILHTNLGRAPLCDAAMQAVAEVMAGYSTLEIDLDTGRRGSRHQHVEPLLIRITGAEAAFVVNNNAAAVLLALTAVARGKQVIVSRGELVEIGGSFRMPEVMAQSGAVLMEVGATNRTHLRDYERAIGADTGLLLKVHRSNFSMTGFVAEVSVADLVELGRRHGIPVMFDLGSGCLVNLRTHGLAYEPTVQDAMTAGCELVTFSGDKLLGGPQAGLIVGRTTFVERIRSHPLARAVRMDKLDYAALAATLQQYVDPEGAWNTVPVLRMLGVPLDDLHQRAVRLRDAVAATVPTTWEVAAQATIAEVGGGSLPEAHLPSYAVAVKSPWTPARLEQALRESRPPIFARIEKNAVLVDVRTLLPGDDEILLDGFRTVTRHS
jgi:L-seryl-tRNA(Ser) seleniumtransferase